MYGTGNEVHEIHHQKQTCFHIPAGTVADRRHDTADTTGQQSEGSQHSRQEAQSQAAGTGSPSAGISRNKVIPVYQNSFLFHWLCSTRRQSVYCTRYTIIRKIIRNPQFVIRITCYTKKPLLYELYGESLFSLFTSILP